MLIAFIFLKTDYEWVVGLNRACLRLLGIWPETYKTARKKLIMNIRIIILLILILCSCTIPIIHSLIRIWGDVTSMIDNLQFTLPLLIAKMKLVIMWQKRTGIPFMTFKQYLKLVFKISCTFRVNS